MNILLTGNGFDLAHRLPTKYIDFIDVADGLSTLKDIKKCKKLAYIMGKRSHLYNSNTWLKECCDIHDGFGGIDLDVDKIETLVKGVKKNLWVQYFIAYKDGNIGWIDFEKEMQEALNIIESVLLDIQNHITNNFLSRDLLRPDQYHKALFFDQIFQEHMNQNGLQIQDQYLNKTLDGEDYAVNCEAIASYLSNELEDLIHLLNIYFEEIINKISSSWERRDIYKQIKNIDFQINFNYTSTLEILYNLPHLNVCYIHGIATDNGRNIILGTRDTKVLRDDIFYNFRKYYQCIQKNYDFSYRKLMNPNSENTYFIWGHSLDDTDGDILNELFTNSDKDKFIIFYHSEDARNELIRNLISNLGKDIYQEYWHSEKIKFEKIEEGDLLNEV